MWESILAEKLNMSIEPSDRLEHILGETRFLLKLRRDLQSQEDIINYELLKRGIIRIGTIKVRYLIE